MSAVVGASFLRGLTACAALMGTLVAAQAADASSSGASQQKTFDDAKAYGKASASTSQKDLASGASENVVKGAIQGYTKTPPEAATYTKQTGSTAAAQQQAGCDPKTSATCAAIAVGTTKLDLSGTGATGSLDAQSAISHPDRVLGNIAQTYNACTIAGTGGPGSGPTWVGANCSISAPGWTDSVCVKSLSLKPTTTTTCIDGSRTVDQRVKNEDNPWWFDVAGYCGISTGGQPMRFEFSTYPSQYSPLPYEDPQDFISVDVNLYHIPDNPALPMQLASVSMPDGKGDVKELRLYMEGTGCQGDVCNATFHWTTPPSYELLYRCHLLPGTVQGTDLKFDTWAPDPAQIGSQCFRPYDSLEAAKKDLGPAVKGGTGETKTGSPNRFWALAGNTSYWRYKWLDIPEHTAFGGSFPLPKAYPAFGDRWTGSCAGLEAATPALPPDGTKPELPLLPMLATDTTKPVCQLKTSVCVDGPSARVIDGVTVHRACWTYRNTFSCSKPADAASCGAAADLSCAKKSVSCKTQDASGHCLDAEFEYECRTSTGLAQQAVNCGDSSFCAGGSCWQSDDTASQPNQNYGQTMAEYQARADAAKDIAIDPVKIEIFKGRDMRCVRANFGLDNCCSGNTLSEKCSAEENELIKLRSESRCTQLGDYCSKSFLGICKEKTRSNCCYNSLLARIVQEQGRPQLGLSQGTAKKPECAGFSPEELSHLDWSQIDLSEYFEQLQLEPKPIPASSAQEGAGGAQSACYYGQGKC
ncbi:MAG: conjugal transfer protein TraN [Rubrivivax sp.]